MNRKFRLWVSINLVGCKQETVIDLPDEDVPEDWQTDGHFADDMLDSLWDSGMIDWGFEEIDD